MAIAFDNSYGGTISGGESVSRSFTIGSGSNRILIVFLYGSGGASGDMDYSSVQFDGTAMTFVGELEEQRSGVSEYNKIEVYYMLEADLPSGGSYNFTCSANSNMWIGGVHILALEGADQGAPEADELFSTQSGLTSWSNSITTLTDGAWVVDAQTQWNGGDSLAADSGQTERSTPVSMYGLYNAGMSTELQATAGSETQGWSWTTTSQIVIHALLSIAPYSAPTGITYVNSTQNNAGSGSTLTLSVPSGTQDGDLLLAFVVIEDDAPDVSWSSVPSGWTLYVDDQATGGSPQSPPKLYVWYRFASSEPSSYDWTADTSGAGLMGSMIAYRGVDATPFDASYTSATGSSGQPNPPSITTITTGSWVVASGFSDDNTGYTALSSGYNSRQTVTDGTGGNGASLGICDFATTGTGSQDPGSYSSGDSEEWGAVTIALQPDQGAPPPGADNAAIMCAHF